MDLASYLEKRGRLVEEALEEALPQTEDLSKNVVEAMRYSLFAGGKRLRPILCLAGAEAVGGAPESALPAAAALEMVHTSSLIHDDLPGMDDDDLRRGRPSNHVAFGEGLAILAGDGLLIDGLGVLALAAARGRTEPERAAAALNVIARAAGRNGMVGGQAVDLASEHQNVGADVVAYIHSRKTAALISASLVSGAILGGGSPEQIRSLEEFGLKIGLAFQIIDDILDVEGETGELGKPAGSDQARGKATYPAVMGLEQSRIEAARLIEEAKKALAGFGPEADPVRAIAEYLLERKK